MTEKIFYYWFLYYGLHQGKGRSSKVPADLPNYNIGGDLDLIGNWGEGVYQTTNLLEETEHKIKTRLYSGYRHEIDNSDEIKCDEEKGIIDFFKGCLLSDRVTIKKTAGSKVYHQDLCFPLLVEKTLLYCHHETI